MSSIFEIDLTVYKKVPINTSIYHPLLAGYYLLRNFKFQSYDRSRYLMKKDLGQQKLIRLDGIIYNTHLLGDVSDIANSWEDCIIFSDRDIV